MRTFLSPFATRLRVLWVALSLVTVACVLLAACGGGQTTASPTATTAPTPTPAPPTPTPTPSPSPTAPPPTTMKAVVTVNPATTATSGPATMPVSAAVVQMVENPPGHYIFQPASITITAGSVVVWIDNSDAPHTVTSDPGAPSAFNTTQNVTQGKTFALQFNQAGTYHYHCNIHPTTMKAVVDVTS